ncbi:glycosyltransferase [Dysgonomonas termitidis]|uniref:Glycosyltransferase n=1 Tax=Dysgonomonas termitidis TaxID=1516126 RepID=A0ABV9KTR3_9BACT
MQKQDNKGISIIICCYNSTARLPETIRHIALQEVDDNISWELIIINNASTDNLETVAYSEWEKYKNTKAGFSIVEEVQQGQTYARRKGVSMAQYEYVLFCDDDNWLHHDYLQNAFRIMETNPQIGALGGQGEAVSDVNFPDWFEDFSDGYAVGKQDKDSGDISQKGYLWGAGMVTRLSLLIKIFDVTYPMLLSGRSEEKLTSGDDSEISQRILLMGYHLFYSQELRFKHFIPHNRLTWKYKKKLFEGFTYSGTYVLNNYMIANQYLHVSKTKLLSSIFKLSVKNILWIVLSRNRKAIESQLSWEKAFFFGNAKFLTDANSRAIFQFYLKYGRENFAIK